MTVTSICTKCREIAFEGKKIQWRSFLTGDTETEIDGNYLSGAGMCERCGNDFCGECLIDGLCIECKEESEGYIPL